MDTICLVRNNIALQEPQVEAVGMGDYLLLRIDLNVDWERWFQVSLTKPKWLGEAPELSKDPGRKKRLFKTKEAARKGWFPPRKKQGQRAKHGRDAQAQYMEQVTEYYRELSRVRDHIRSLARWVHEFPESDSTYYMVYDDTLSWLGRVQGAGLANELAQLWQKYFPYPEFQKYASAIWMERLAPETPSPNILILGKGEGIYSILEKHARKIKDVRWILFREDCDEVFQNFVEDFYLEHGLVIRYHVIADVAYLQETGVSCPEQTTVFDFTGGLSVKVKKMVPGSVWLDVRSSYTKWQQIRPFTEGPNATLEYKSHYKIWTETQKKYNRPYFLDSIAENGYNTLETVGARGYKSNEQR